MKYTLYISLLILSISSCSSSCTKDKTKWEEVLFEFEIPLNIIPGKDTVRVGETLTLNADFSDSLFDFYSQKKYHLPDFNLNTVAVFKKLTNPSIDIIGQHGSFGYFNVVNTIGSLNITSETFADVSYVYQNNKYMLTVNIQPKEPGVYALWFYHSTGTRGSTKLPQELAPNEPGIKRLPEMRHIRYVFNNGNTNFNIYKQHCKPADPNEATNWVESKATYTFVVK